MIKFILLSLCIYSVRSLWIDDLVSKVPQCSKNEEYQCGSACFESCQGIPEICTLQLVCGCVCKAGYVRQTDSKTSPCIKKETCPAQQEKCGVNEVYSSCGSYCPPTCEDLQYSPNKQPIACIAMCKVGCTCKRGFYRSSNGTCVPPAQCCTGPNEVYRSYGTSCQPTCQTPNPGCIKISVQGCFCQSPKFVRKCNETNSTCIPVDQC